MAEKGIIVADAATGENIACRDAVQNDDVGAPRIIQLVDTVGRKNLFDGATPTRSLSIPSDGRGDTFNLNNIPADIISTAITMGDADSVVVAVQFSPAAAVTDSKIIVTPIVFDGTNVEPVAILEPKSFNMIYDSASNLILALGDGLPAGWTIDNGVSNLVTDEFVNFSGGKGPVLSPDKTKFMYVDSIEKYLVGGTLSTPGVLSSYGSEVTIALTGSPYDMAINPAGTILIVAESPDILREYTFGIAYDISTVTASGVTYTLGLNGGEGMEISTDGYHLYIQKTSDIDHYILSTAWDISSTISFSETVDLSTIYTGNDFRACKINSDGTRYLMLEYGSTGNKQIVQMEFPTPYSLVNSTDSGFYIDLGTEGYPKGIEVPEDGSNIYISSSELISGVVWAGFLTYDLDNTPVMQKILTPMQSWNSLGSQKIGFHIYHDSTDLMAVDVNLFAGAISKDVPGYNILEKSISGIAGSFPVKVRYGASIGG